MSNDDFEALVTLIMNLIAYSRDMNAHPADRPRQEALYREREAAIEHARSILVL